MTAPSCPFCQPDAARVFYDSDLVLGIWDAFAVTPGHALLVAKRHVANWFELTLDERLAIDAALFEARSRVETLHAPAGFNIGVNIGDAAGQTIPHVHVHLIPRYVGDVPDPRGGVRHVIPSKGNYLKTGESRNGLVPGDDDPLLPHILFELARAERADIVVSFALTSGVERVFPHFDDLLKRGGRLRLLTGDYLGITEPDALSKLLDLEGGVECRVFETAATGGGSSSPAARSFHPKAYIFHRDGGGCAFVGSSNLSSTALTTAVEWNYRVVASQDTTGFGEVTAAFERLFSHPSVRALTEDWIAGYRQRRPYSRQSPVADVEPELSRDVPRPNSIQERALTALVQTREAGNKAGLVVLATGLGKTWLAAFDCDRPGFRRVLFVAHREEILEQARTTFRRIRPSATLGHFTGDVKQGDADIVFASIQTLGRDAHLKRFLPDAFDYIVVDEFHHAAASSYRRLIEHFRPQFLLGLTATPERSDGGDLLTLCHQNLVFRCELAEGVHQGLLSPFRYFGVPDEVDYTNIPWRSTRFDEDALTTAVATQRRAENALEQLRSRGGRRAIGFCVSQRHADFMASFFAARGVRAAAVHSGPSSAPRALSLERLDAGELDIVFAVDMFNEGVDLPNLDTVMMLRPTESRILWLQQFGRGLRRAPGKERLVVIDYIGNHRVFLLKPQTLFGLRGGDKEVFNLLERLRDGSQTLPAGCEVTYDLEAVNILRGLLRTSGGQQDALQRHYYDFKSVHGVRPSAVEMFHDGYNPRAVRQQHESWTRFVESQGDLSAAQKVVRARHAMFLDALDTTDMSKSYKMVLLLAMLNADRFPGAITVDELADAVAEYASRTARVAADLGVQLEDRRALIRSLEQNPIAAWCGGRGTAGVSYFAYQDKTFRTTFDETGPSRTEFQEMVREVAEWRLAEYLERVRTQTSAAATLKVSHSEGKPLLYLPVGAEREDLPRGWTPVIIDEARFEANFVKIAINVVRADAESGNLLPSILRRWFGPDAGAPGTRHTVALRHVEDAWRLEPIGVRRTGITLWHSYSREEIPALFGLEFSTAIWNAGFVRRPGHIFLLVTLDKSGHGGEFQYSDRFLSPTEFEWQSQNRTTQSSKDGMAIRSHLSEGVAVHLFVRAQKKQPRGGSAPFCYCGEVRFASWQGEQPITVRWTLPTPVPAEMASSLRVPPA